MRDLHEHYDTLTDGEREFVDRAFRFIFQQAKLATIPLWGDDRAEVAVDALARLVVESREGAQAFDRTYPLNT